MKNFKVFSFVLMLILVSCNTTRKVVLDKNPAIEFKTASYQEVYPGQVDGQKLIVLNFPILAPVEGYEVDSIYFRTFHEPLQLIATDQEYAYRARIVVDPLKTTAIPPFPISDQEALVTYKNKKGKPFALKVSNIDFKEPIYRP